MVRKSRVPQRDTPGPEAGWCSWSDMERRGLFVLSVRSQPLMLLLILSPSDNQNKSATPTTKWEAKLKDLIWSFEDEQFCFRHYEWRNVFENQVKSTPLTITALANPLFSLPLGEDQQKWTVWLSPENLWARYSTLSHIAVQEGEQRAVRQPFSVQFRSPKVNFFFLFIIVLIRHNRLQEKSSTKPSVAMTSSETNKAR